MGTSGPLWGPNITPVWSLVAYMGLGRALWVLFKNRFSAFFCPGDHFEGGVCYIRVPSGVISEDLRSSLGARGCPQYGAPGCVASSPAAGRLPEFVGGSPLKRTCASFFTGRCGTIAIITCLDLAAELLTHCPHSGTRRTGGSSQRAKGRWQTCQGPWSPWSRAITRRAWLDREARATSTKCPFCGRAARGTERGGS